MAPQVLRHPSGDDAASVTNMELFFDLVYVFAITQLSDFLYLHPSARGALQGLILFGAVWWAWNYTAWATNWIDPDQPTTALLMLVLMGLSLVVAAALPHAFGARGAPFAIAYAALQLLRTGWVAAAFPDGDAMRANNLHLLAWLAIGAAVWIAGAFLPGDARLAVWAAAVVVELAAPLHGFRLPRVGATPIAAWRLTGAHLAERYQLVLIIALGESVLRVGATFSDVHHSGFVVGLAFVVGFVVSAALWATYFMRLAERAARRAAASREGSAARLGRAGYAYAHAAMVAGVIVVAVAIRMTIERPESPAGVFATFVCLGGPALYLAGLAIFERSARVASPAGPIGAIVVLALLVVPAAGGADRLVLLGCAAVVLVAFVGAAKLLPRRRVPRSV